MSAATAARAPTHTTETAPATPALPRLLAGIPAHGAITLERHLALHGELPQRSRRRRGVRAQALALIAEVERAGLAGRGGAAFPTAVKMRAVAQARRRAIVLVNAAESEPASRKDRTLLALAPHLVLDGGLLAARAVGADEVIVCACESAGAGADAVAQAIAERARAGGEEAELRLRTVPSHYVASQESALVSHLNGGPAKPTFTPPMPFQRGVAGRPTLVNNAETLAHLALIARHGAEWFRQLGTPAQPGSALVTLSGSPVGQPGVYEIEPGASLASLIDAAGGVSAPPRAALVGGYGGTWVGAERLPDLALSSERLAAHGATLGAGVVVLLSQLACPAAESARLARWLADQSVRQCGPCLHGLDALAHSLEQIAAGAGGAGADARISRLASLGRGRGACGHPDGAIRVILSAVQAFAAELAEHARHGPCQACARPAELPLPARPIQPAAQQKASPRR